jgi:hypothetical protein
MQVRDGVGLAFRFNLRWLRRLLQLLRGNPGRISFALPLFERRHGLLSVLGCLCGLVRGIVREVSQEI